jgi:hypothetical protein
MAVAADDRRIIFPLYQGPYSRSGYAQGRKDGRFMREVRWMVLLLLATSAGSGCKGHHRRKYAAYPEPGPCAGPVEGGTPVMDGPTMLRPLSFIDRHPLLSKPREFYEDTDYNPIVKTAAAVVIGVPAGIVGEVRQIVAGPRPTSQIGAETITQ